MLDTASLLFRPVRCFSHPGVLVLSFCASSSRRDVLVTGMGMVTPLGCSSDETWARLVRGERAGRRLMRDEIDHYDALNNIAGLCLNGAPVDHGEVAERLRASHVMRNLNGEIQNTYASEPLVAMSLLAFSEAMTEARLSQRPQPSDRVAVLFGSSKGGLRTAERLAEMLPSPSVARSRNSDQGSSQDSDQITLLNEPQAAVDRTGFGTLWANTFATDSATRAIANIAGAGAGVICPVAACATGLISILQGAAMIHSGFCDVCIVGSADAGLRASVLSSFHRLRVTSRNPDGAEACRPFDESRDGFLVGEGAAVLILESREHAAARGVQGIAKVLAGGWLSDPTGMTQIDASGSVVAEVLKRTMAAISLRPDVLSLHGTGTVSNDLAEARGILSVFGDSAPQCFGVKGALGHLLGAAGSVETALTVLSLQHRGIPGTTNLKRQDSRCGIPLQSDALQLPSLFRAAKLSLGFGGHVACGVFESL